MAPSNLPTTLELAEGDHTTTLDGRVTNHGPEARTTLLALEDRQSTAGAENRSTTLEMDD